MSSVVLKGKKILIVDDEEDIRRLLSYNLVKEEAIVEVASDGNSALRIANSKKFDLILLDVMMPDRDGIEVCELIRKGSLNAKSLIVMISARGEDYSQLAGYHAGADDYVVKPVRIKVLIKKLEVLFERNITVESERKIHVDKEKFIVKIDREELLLPKKEFELLNYLIDNSETVCKRADILKNVWTDTIIGDRTIDVHIRKLREKLGQDLILTLKGVGYKFNPHF